MLQRKSVSLLVTEQREKIACSKHQTIIDIYIYKGWLNPPTKDLQKMSYQWQEKNADELMQKVDKKKLDLITLVFPFQLFLRSWSSTPILNLTPPRKYVTIRFFFSKKNLETYLISNT